MVRVSEQYAREVALTMPKIARRILWNFFSSVKLPQTQIFSLMVLQENGPCRLSDMMKDLHVSAPTASGIVERLETGGFVKRRTDPADQRAQLICLTPKGRSVVYRAQSTLQKKWTLILQHLAVREQRGFVRTLNSIKDICDEIEI